MEYSEAKEISEIVSRIESVERKLAHFSELPTHAKGDELGFVLHSNLLTAPKS